MSFKSPSLLDIYTEMFIDEVCYKVIQGVEESEDVDEWNKIGQEFKTVEAGWWLQQDLLSFFFLLLSKFEILCNEKMSNNGTVCPTE